MELHEVSLGYLTDKSGDKSVIGSMEMKVKSTMWRNQIKNE